MSNPEVVLIEELFGLVAELTAYTHQNHSSAGILILPAVVNMVESDWRSDELINFVPQLDWEGLETKDVLVCDIISLIVKHKI